MKLKVIIWFLFLSMVSCNRVQQETVVATEEPEMEIDIDSLNRVSEASKAIYRVFEISEDTIFASRHYGGLVYSTDGGANWKKINNTYGFDDFIISKGGVLVGLGYWVGIHESDYSKLYISKNFGQDWEKIEYDTKDFFPVKIVSKPYENLKIQTNSQEVFELTDSDYLKGWNKVVFKDSQKDAHIKIKYNDRDNRNVFLFTEEKGIMDTIGRLNLFTEVDTLLSLGDYTYVNGSGNDLGEDAHFACFAVLNKENELKEFKLPGSYSYMKKTNLGRIFLYNGEGIFQVKNDTLIQIY